MKKVCIISFILLSLLCLNGCVRSVSIENSEQNFKEYTKAVESVAEKYGYTFTSKSNLDHVREKYFNENTTITVNINDTDYIDVSINSRFVDEFEKNKCTEYFSIKYCLGYSEEAKQFDTALFVEFSDIFRKDKIDKKTCDEALKDIRNNPKETHTFGVKYENYEKINSEDDCLFYYALYDNQIYNNVKEELELSGYTDKSAPVTYTKQVFTSWILIISILICAGIIVTYRDIRKQKRLKKLYFKAE